MIRIQPHFFFDIIKNILKYIIDEQVEKEQRRDDMLLEFFTVRMLFGIQDKRRMGNRNKKKI